MPTVQGFDRPGLHKIQNAGYADVSAKETWPFAQCQCGRPMDMEATTRQQTRNPKPLNPKPLNPHTPKSLNP